MPAGLLAMPPSPPPTSRRGLSIVTSRRDIGAPVGELHWKSQELARGQRLQAKVVGMGILAFICAAALPLLSAVALLMDQTYVFWLGRKMPYMLLGISCAIVLLVAVAGVVSHRCGSPRFLDERALAWGAVAFAGLLGIALLLLALPGLRDLQAVAVQASTGCSVANTDAAALQHYYEVLAKIRGSAACDPSRKDSVEECAGWVENKYTTYLRYLEQNLQCRAYCSEEIAEEPALQQLQAAAHVGSRKRHHRASTARGAAAGAARTAASALQVDHEVAAASDLNRTIHKAKVDWFHITGTSGTRDAAPRRRGQAPDSDGIKVGDAVEINADKAEVEKAFGSEPSIVWQKDMTAMVGNVYRVLALHGQQAVGVRSPDGSQEGVWYFPLHVVKKASLPSWPRAGPTPRLFAPEGETQMVCYPLVASHLFDLAVFCKSILFWQGLCLITTAVAAGASPLLAAFCCGVGKR